MFLPIFENMLEQTDKLPHDTSNIFKVQGKTFVIDKKIFSLQAECFLEALEENKDNMSAFEKFSAETFEQLFWFVYTNSINISEVSLSTLIDLLQLSKIVQLQNLEKLCQKKLLEFLTKVRLLLIFCYNINDHN